eukprot:360210-Chlamydomonas_euryale.AAC.7
MRRPMQQRQRTIPEAHCMRSLAGVATAAGTAAQACAGVATPTGGLPARPSMRCSACGSCTRCSGHYGEKLHACEPRAQGMATAGRTTHLAAQRRRVLEPLDCDEAASGAVHAFPDAAIRALGNLVQKLVRLHGVAPERPERQTAAPPNFPCRWRRARLPQSRSRELPPKRRARQCSAATVVDALTLRRRLWRRGLCGTSVLGKT